MFKRAVSPATGRSPVTSRTPLSGSGEERTAREVAVNMARDNGATPLFVAAQNGHETMVRALIEMGADVNKAMDDGVPPLLIAAYNGHEAVVRALIDLECEHQQGKE